MFDWFWCRLGYHVCTNFTPWKKMQANYVRQPVFGESNYLFREPVEYTRAWQERSCTECGKVEQEELKL